MSSPLTGARCLEVTLVSVILSCLTACGSVDDRALQVRFFEASEYPQQLSSWGLLNYDTEVLEVAAGNHVYDLNTALFTDYALKLRTLYLPPGSTATFNPDATFDLPAGSIIAKTFFYTTDQQQAVVLDAAWDGDPDSLDATELRLIETRLLVRQAQGWDALPYIWRGNDAYLSITGDIFSLPLTDGAALTYVVPTRNQCAGCHAENHTSGELLPIGIKARHLHREDPIHGENQLLAWQRRGQLQGLPPLEGITANARRGDTDSDLQHRARSYLDINCGHCHNPAGAADTSGLLLDYGAHAPAALGVCKPPIAAGRGSGGFLYSIVPGKAHESILSFRMSTTDPATMMPELGRTLVHAEGLSLIETWINSMQGACL